jgi:ribosomal 30S subunit maturation factor RimM
VLTASGRELGTVASMLAYPSCDLLDVTGAGGQLLVPMVRDAIVRVDIPGRQIVVDARFLGLTAPEGE